MYLTQCPACGHRISSQAQSCPSCGQPLKAKTGGGITFWGVVGAVILAILIMSFE
ncbi:zinc ribbon domain-containing protein [Paenibacillus agilis]|uniref:Zinc-ribbon domain-containing protein n=1 Tax=Paenibacillus agilis TaxID=3020863 RepID=A0A559IZY4_9BACL|nr:zinc-ribbon domain-containing protein [Paenibacillus agilis]